MAAESLHAEEDTVACPGCGARLPVGETMRHADLCAAPWRGDRKLDQALRSSVAHSRALAAASSAAVAQGVGEAARRVKESPLGDLSRSVASSIGGLFAKKKPEAAREEPEQEEAEEEEEEEQGDAAPPPPQPDAELHADLRADAGDGKGEDGDGDGDGEQLSPEEWGRLEDAAPQVPTLARQPSDPGARFGAPDVVLVGAGPVGLWTAVQIKVMRPELSVLLLEKHAEYQRSHVLRVSASSFVLAPADARVRALVAGVPAVIRTNDLEDRLLRLAHELRVRIEIRAVASVDEVLCDFPSARVVIGSDGARSIVRRSAFGDALAVNRVLQSIVDLKYEVEGGGAEPLSKLAEAYPTIKLMGYAAEEHIGQARDGRCPVTLRLVVRESDANALEDATFKTPFALPADAARLPPQLMRAICVWLGAKRLLKGERRVRGSERLSCIKLAVYRAAELTRGHGGVALALVGDAAFGVPFFRALNNGLRCGSMLARALAEGPWELGGEAGIAARLRAYAAKASALAKREIALAASKSAVLDVAQMHSRMVAKLPLQVIAWSPRQATLLATREVAFPN